MPDRAEAVTPTAAALVTAVATRNAAAVEQLLRGCADLHALAVVLADNVGCVHDTRLLPRQPVKRSRARCHGCSRPTRSAVGLCATCADVTTSPTELPGRWVRDPRRGVQVYVA